MAEDAKNPALVVELVVVGHAALHGLGRVSVRAGSGNPTGT
jgi:hypothetical protein